MFTPVGMTTLGRPGRGCYIGTSGSMSTSIGEGARDVDYCLIADGLVIFRNKIYVMDNHELNKVISREFHAKPYSSHPGYQKTLTVVKKFYYWPNMKRDVAEFVARCSDCQRVKAECKHLGGLLQPITIPEWKWEVISMYSITRLLKTVRQHDSVMVVVDRLKKIARFIPMRSTFSASDVA